MSDPLWKLALGLLSGFAFGFLLQKGRVAKFEVIVGQLLLRDWTVVKIMLTAIAVGGIGVYTLTEAGWASLHVKPLMIGGVLVGATVFGIGMAVLGYCPGTAVAACGEGRRDAMAGVFGMLLGATVYVLGYSLFQPIMTAGDFGKVTLPELTGLAPRWWLAGLVLLVVATRFLVNRLYEKTLGHEQNPAVPSRP